MRSKPDPNPGPTKSALKRCSSALLKVGFTLLGVYLLFLSAQGISWAALGQYVRGAGWAVLASLLIFPLVTIFHAMGLYLLLPLQARQQISIGRMYRITLFGEAMNKVTPFVDMGGEPFKISLLARTGAIGTLSATRAVWRSRIAFVMSEAVYLLPALALLTWRAPSEQLTWMTCAAIAMTLIHGLILYVIKRGVVASAAPGDERVGLSDRAASFVWHTLGWAALTVETYLILKLIGVPVTAAEAFVIQGLLQAVKTVSFFIPANIGSQEGGLAVFLAHFGYAAEGGLALSLLKRARQFIWALAGMAAFFILKKHLPPPVKEEALSQ